MLKKLHKIYTYTVQEMLNEDIYDEYEKLITKASELLIIADTKINGKIPCNYYYTLGFTINDPKVLDDILEEDMEDNKD